MFFNAHDYKAVLCLNGDLPKIDFFKSIKLPIFATDGAANKLYQQNIKFKAIIGDFDSVDEKILQYDHFEKYYIPCQNHQNDFEKALSYLYQKKITPLIIAGMSGGYLDHILNNISIFSQTNDMFYSDELLGFIVEHQKQFFCPTHTKISIIPLPEAFIETQGLKWDLNNQHLLFGKNMSCFNRTIKNNIHIHVKTGKALVLIYTQHIKDAGY